MKKITDFLKVDTILITENAKKYPNVISRIINKWSEVEVREVDSFRHYQILEGADYLKSKRSILILDKLKNQSCRVSGRSADYMAPSFANGCTGACAYCYVARHKPEGNPITAYVNADACFREILNHNRKLVPKKANQTDAIYHTYDIGCNSDISVDSYVNPDILEYMEYFTSRDTPKLTFATKFFNEEMLNLRPQRKIRVRYTLMPKNIAKTVDVRTLPIMDRLKAAVLLWEAGYEVHFNFSPVILYDGWLEEWEQLFVALNELPEGFKKQCACEVIMLIHNKKLNEINKTWYPKEEEILWMPELQESKLSLNGQVNIRYKADIKESALIYFKDLVNKMIPWCKIRYSF